MAEWQSGVYGQRTVLTKDVSLVSVLALLASVELGTQRAERKREGAGERVWRESIHGPLPCTYSRIRNMTRAEREGSKPDILYQHGREQGPLSVDIPQSPDCTKSTKLRSPA